MIRMTMLLDDPADTMVWIGRGEELFERHSRFTALRAVNAARRGLAEQAGNYLRPLVTAFPDAPAVLFARAKASVFNGSRDMNELSLEAISKSGPNDWHTPLSAALVLMEKKYWNRAAEMLGIARKINQEHATLRYYLGICHGKLGRSADAQDSILNAQHACSTDHPICHRIMECPVIIPAWRRLFCRFLPR
jgi:predicted Zn-dependent protease